ncbi:AAA family ATPase [Alicyclobacillus cycloheptanicus]|uniref:MoxR-like ATPase n=1 Tax=Alicyclobacillus cycloheptanicus TaxID=1457 RepID=A0ABT9XIU4_9BACL|nr:MoxR family ATPase [Alicyclobacillus cycloheptanicus]MDQ0190227.1 MoxR-like ATPase [Alicyclobacillus cycloheptanicus]
MLKDDRTTYTQNRTSTTVELETAEAWAAALAEAGYLADDGMTAMVQLAVTLQRPLLLEGPAGVGKTALAQALAKVLDRDLIRLQCFEGLDAAQALYDWNYHRQLADVTANRTADVFTEAYILPRPLLRALMSARGAVLLIDEVDRADEAFEALLLEYLAEHQISIPEWRTVTARVTPVTILTSNRTRPLSDALRRRSLYHRVSWPDVDRETAVVKLHVPNLDVGRIVKVVAAVQRLRSFDLLKPPGLSETIDWARALEASDAADWSEAWVRRTLGCAVKDAIDMEAVLLRIRELVEDT